MQRETGRVRLTIPSGAVSGTAYLSLRPTKAQIYSVPVTITVNSNTLPVGDATFVAMGARIQVPAEFMGQQDNRATVYSAPGASVRLSING